MLLAELARRSPLLPGRDLLAFLWYRFPPPLRAWL